MSYGDGDMHQLVGRTINGISVSEGEALMVFDTNLGPVAYLTEGDCCSSTWFADVLGVQALLGGTVAKAEAVAMPTPEVSDGRERDESDQYYGVRITTDKGRADIVYRNSSNGYYGGSIDFVTEWRSEAMTPITADWSAGHPADG